MSVRANHPSSAINTLQVMHMPDPVRSGATCMVRINRVQVRMTRLNANVTMHIAVAVADYIGLVAFEAPSGGYGLKLAHCNPDLCIPLGQFIDLTALERACHHWQSLTGKALLVEADGVCRRIGTPPSPDRRPGTGSATTHRRGNFARRRKAGTASSAGTVVRDFREIIARN